MHSRSHPHRHPADKEKRFNRILGEVNAFLVVLAIGLAVLDFTGFVVLKASTELARAQADAALAATATAVGTSALSR